MILGSRAGGATSRFTVEFDTENGYRTWSCADPCILHTRGSQPLAAASVPTAVFLENPP